MRRTGLGLDDGPAEGAGAESPLCAAHSTQHLHAPPAEADYGLLYASSSTGALMHCGLFLSFSCTPRASSSAWLATAAGVAPNSPMRRQRTDLSPHRARIACEDMESRWTTTVVIPKVPGLWPESVPASLDPFTRTPVPRFLGAKRSEKRGGLQGF